MSDFLPVAALALVLALGRWLLGVGARDTAHNLAEQAHDANAEQLTPTPLPPDTLIEIGESAFTVDEASKIVCLRDYWQGAAHAGLTAAIRPQSWRGNGTGGAA